MKLYSWNVNGLRACTRKGFLEWLAQSQGDIIGLQEVRALPEQLDESVRSPEAWHTHFSPAERKGYSGVGLYSRQTADDIDISLDEARFDCEGRVQFAHFGQLVIVNVYFPNGSGKNRDHSRVPYKLDFYAAIRKKAERISQAGKRVIVMGDYNTAMEEIDLARPKTNHKTSGFLAEERDAFRSWIQGIWSDVFRAQNPDLEGAYTWWSNRSNARARNVGWRIDYILACPNALPFVHKAAIHPHDLGSDHCPISLELDEAVTKL